MWVFRHDSRNALTLRRLAILNPTEVALIQSHISLGVPTHVTFLNCP